MDLRDAPRDASIPVPSFDCAYFPSPRGCALIRSSHQAINSVSPCRRLPRPGRGGKSHVFSSLPPLIYPEPRRAISWLSFCNSRRLFSTACKLFCENTGGGKTDARRSDVETFRRPTFRRSDIPTRRSEKAKAPPCDGASAINRNSLLAEAVDQPALYTQVVLFCPAEVRVQIFKLDRTERQVASQLEIGSAAERHRKRIQRLRRDTRLASRQPFAAEQHLRVRSHAAVVVIRHARPEQVVDFMRRDARRQTGDFAAVEIADYRDPLIQIGRQRAP